MYVRVVLTVGHNVMSNVQHVLVHQTHNVPLAVLVISSTTQPVTQHVQSANGKTLLLQITTYALIVKQVVQLVLIQVMFVNHV